MERKAKDTCKNCFFFRDNPGDIGYCYADEMPTTDEVEACVRFEKMELNS